VTENFCTSSLQCYLFMIDYGVRNGGGIGDVLPMISYKNSTAFFYGKFFYNLFFYILIIMVLGNIFLGIIVDTFADLRDKNQLNYEDKLNKCYICQITRDESLIKKIEFDSHREKNHNVLNYIYFLTYLYITNNKDFNYFENQTWERLECNDITWIPVEY
jgi:hypothetical protein